MLAWYFGVVANAPWAAISSLWFAFAYRCVDEFGRRRVRCPIHSATCRTEMLGTAAHKLA